ncbi:MAG: transcription factor S [Nitrososphaeria archaeon]
MKKEENRPIKVLSDAESKIETMPTIEIECPKCGNNKSYWWLLQTRSGDEPPTQFYRCTKCGYTWRMYA